MMSPTLTQDLATAYTAELLGHYNFELHGYRVQDLVNRWANRYPSEWIRLAAIEALYQGRYKAHSIEKLLAIWARRDNPIYHFSTEFERLIGRRFSPDLRSLPPAPPVPQPPRQLATLQEIPDRIDAREQYDRNYPTTQTNLAPVSPPAGSFALDFGGTFVNSDGYEDKFSAALADSASSDLVLADRSLALSHTDDSSDLEAEIVYQADWCDWEASKQPIDRFTPERDFSGFYRKLKAIASS
ncbi:MAG: hypothetical protein KME17_16275 [Cyanosarcina radialis HA8281-LM2]|jgi:hypothetical protein|nr:hypothetical protein [Cyanosarcina radialis HA8281-LM2]